MGNISRVLLNLFKRLIFVMFKDSSSLPAVNIHIFSLGHQLRLLLALTFVPLPCLFGFCHDMYIHLGRVYLRDFALVFLILNIAPFILESLLSNIPVTIAIFQKVPGHLFVINEHNIIFLEFIFNFDVRSVSRKFTIYSCLHLCQK